MNDADLMIADNIVHFARVLRAAGMPIGPDRVLAAMAAIEHVGFDRRDDVHAALGAVMLDRHEQQALFDAAFDAFWRDPKWLEQMMELLLPKVHGRGTKAVAPRANRLADALAAPRSPELPKPAGHDANDELQFDTSFTYSDRERLQQADFETMTAAEFELAQKLAEQVPLPVRPVRRRRHEAASRGTLDLRATMLRMARQPHTLAPAFTRPRTEMPTLVVLLDISGSMDRYARLLLHYVHGLTRRYIKVHTLMFGTRLTNITRCLRHRDPDVALELADAQVQDWRGGTRIASCLADFNQRWGRRVLAATPRCCWSPTASIATNTASSPKRPRTSAHREPDRVAQSIAALRRLRAARRRRPRAPAARRPDAADAQSREPGRARPRDACTSESTSLRH